MVGSVPDGWWRDRAGAARRLLDRLAPLPGRSIDGRQIGRVVVVLEGRARPAAPEGPLGEAVKVRHAPGAGDDLLAELAGPGTLLVTADHALAARARARGARVVGPSRLLELLEPREP